MTQTKYTDGSGVGEIWVNIKNYIAAQLLGKSNVGHTHSASDITSGLASVATSGSYNDLSNKPTIPTVNNATLKIQKNGTDIKTFTANASSDVTCNITVPTKTSDLTNDSGFLTSHQDLSGYIPRSGGSITGDSLGRNVDDDNLRILGGIAWNSGAQLQLCGKDMSGGFGGTFTLYANSGYNVCALQGTPSGVLTWANKNVAMQEDTVPRSGGAVISGTELCRSTDDSALIFGGGSANGRGATIELHGKDSSLYAGWLVMRPHDSINSHSMLLKPDGTWTWDGTACQIISDQRLKQQIAEIDDKLLDAWEDVNLVQFKYNDAVKEKSDNARLHTGFVVQQIDDACKSHGVDISAYGLYCHEEYPQETEEVEVEQEDGTKVKETKVIREASEHYSLRYTEVYAVECMYLRRCIARLTARIEELEKGNNVK